MDDEFSQRIEEPAAEGEEPVTKEEARGEYLVDESDEALTGTEVKEAAADLMNRGQNTATEYLIEAKDMWVKPIRKGVRRWFSKGRKFFDELGGS